MKIFSLSLIMLFSVFAFGQSKPISKEVKGTIILKEGLNKAGNALPGEGDYYLEYNGNSYFIKLSGGNVTRDELKKVLNIKTTFEVIQGNGLWDTDDPNVQSRIGDFVRILEIHTP